MEHSENFNFSLPSRDTDDIVDINEISDNFRIIDGKLFDLDSETADQTYDPASANAQSGIAVAEAIAAQPKQIPEITSLTLSDETPLGVYILKGNSNIRYVSKYNDGGLKEIPFSNIKVESDTLINISRIPILVPPGMSRYGIRVMFLSEVTEFDSVVPIKRTLGYIEYWKESSSSTGYPATGTITYYNYASKVSVEEAVTEAKGYTDTKIGSIDTALDNIIALQNSYIGGNA